MFSRIVVPLDGSGFAEQALPFAGDLARRGEIPLHLVRVFDISPLDAYGPYAFGIAETEFEQVVADERASAKGYLGGIASTYSISGLDVTHDVLQGATVETLIHIARPGDLMVMASHGRGGPARWFLGSVAEAITRRSPVPVLLVRGAAAVSSTENRGGSASSRPATRQGGPAYTYKRIVIALDGSAIAEQALAPAEEIVQVVDAPMHLVRVVDLLPVGRVDTYALGLLGPSSDALVDEEKKAAREYLQQVQRRYMDRGVTVTTEVRIGLLPQELLAAVTSGDMLVIASHGRGGMARWLLGSVAEAITRRSPVPVLLVRDSGAAVLPREALVEP